MAGVAADDEIDFGLALFTDTTDENCTQYTTVANRCRALISAEAQCSCRRAYNSDFCNSHKAMVAVLTAGYQVTEQEYSNSHTIDDLRRATYASALSGAECRRVLNLLYAETAARMWLSYVYFNDLAWGMIDAHNRNGHVHAINRREQAIARLEQYCNVDDEEAVAQTPTD